MKKILIAEDDQFLSDAYVAKLTFEGYEIETAMDGEEALLTLQTFKPDLMILDLVMPKLDGYMVLTEIRKNDEFKNLPVIVASNLGQKEDIEHAKALGATDFVVKTDLSIKDLVEKVKRLLE